MTARYTTLTEESARPDVDGFYVPRFRVTVGGEPIRDITGLTYKDSLTELDAFSFTVSNWHDSANEHRYIGSEPPDYTGHPRATEFHLLEPSSAAVDVEIGYGNDLTLMMQGTITSMSPRFSGGGAGSLTISGVNTLYALRSDQRTLAWFDATDSEIAESLGHGLGASKDELKRKPFRVCISDVAETKRPYVAQKNQYDIDFLLMLARRNGYVVVSFDVDGAQPNDPAEHFLYFGPSGKFEVATSGIGTKRIAGRAPAVRDVNYWLRWGESLIDVSPTLTTSNQIGFVEVRGWDRVKKEAISVRVEVGDPRVTANRDLLPIMSKVGAKGEVVVDEPVATREEAEVRALAIMNDQRKQTVTIQASTVGLPDLRSGRMVRLGGMGARLSGLYFVTESEHGIGASGYTTKFSARREGPEPT